MVARFEPGITRNREEPGRVRVKELNNVKREIVNDALKIHVGLEESVYQRVLAKSFVNDLPASVSSLSA